MLFYFKYSQVLQNSQNGVHGQLAVKLVVLVNKPDNEPAITIVPIQFQMIKLTKLRIVTTVNVSIGK